MNVMYVVSDPTFGKDVVPERDGIFSGFNMFREIQVTNPEDVYGDPLYVGQANMAHTVLPVGAYWFEFTDEHDFTD
jgi:hypothetical protein